MTTFPDQLRSLAYALDVISDNQLVEISQDIVTYLKRYSIERVDFLTVVHLRDGFHLFPQPDISTKGATFPFPLYVNSGQPNGICAYSFITKKQLWIVPETQKRENIYSSTINRINLLDQGNNPPEPQGYDVGDYVCTEIAIPVRLGETWVGVADFRTEQYAGYSERLFEQLRQIAEALAILTAVYEHSDKSSRSTSIAIRRLKDSAISNDIYHDDSSLAFLISSSRRETDVTAIVQKALHCFPELRVRTWEDNSNSGPITDALLTDILSARILIAYLSEPNDAQGSQHRFVDNPNVLFECGVYQASIHQGRKEKDSLIIIREKDSPNLPFDISNLNILGVQRWKDGGFGNDILTNAIKERLKTTLDRRGQR